MRRAKSRGREGLRLVDHLDLVFGDHITAQHPRFDRVGNRGRHIVFIGNTQDRVVVLAGIDRFKITLGQHVKITLQNRTGRLEARVRGWRGEGKLFALDVFDLFNAGTWIGDDFHLVAKVAILGRHDREGVKARTVDRQRVGPGVETRNMQPARAHGFDLGCVVLHWEEHHRFAGLGLQMGQKIGPCLFVDGGVFNGCIGKDQRVRVNLIRRIRGGVRNQIAINIAKLFVQVAPRAILRSNRSGKRKCKCHSCARHQ
mmetsp:Transcript_21203/g.31008  ORF Transcript_21203/g.31008 Transcript_21203/m.31008 type:complete len:257 (-) Transcript_21203:47-817(-)